MRTRSRSAATAFGLAVRPQGGNSDQGILLQFPQRRGAVSQLGMLTALNFETVSTSPQRLRSAGHRHRSGRGAAASGSGNVPFYQAQSRGERQRSGGASSATASGGMRRGRFPSSLGHGMAHVVRFVGSNVHLEIMAGGILSGDPSLDYERLVSLDEEVIRDKNRADNDQIDSLPKMKATAKDKDIRCCVCMCDVEEGEELRQLPCSHKYHRACIDGKFCRFSLVASLFAFSV